MTVEEYKYGYGYGIIEFAIITVENYNNNDTIYFPIVTENIENIEFDQNIAINRNLFNHFSYNYLDEIITILDVEFFVPIHTPVLDVNVTTSCLRVIYYHDSILYNRINDSIDDNGIYNINISDAGALDLEQLYYEEYRILPPFEPRFYIEIEEN